MNSKQSGVRVRFAPSPTGNLHIGNLRAALFNWLFARHNNGSFVVRIEDTDYERSRQEYVDAIVEALTWAGLASDEPLVFQSERTAIYKKYLAYMVEEGHAYWSDPAEEDNDTSVIRFRVPRNRGMVSFNDLIRGTVSIDVDQIDDFVIARADGSPLYNFCVVVDDAIMKISHVIRGEDHISNTVRQILMYEALGFDLPQFAHLSLILGPTGAPLSKRDAVTGVLQYRDAGYLPDALCNYLARLGWAHGDQEIFTRQELIDLFSLEEVNKSGATFDAEKLAWVNAVHLREKTAQELIALIEKTIEPNLQALCSGWSPVQLNGLVELYKDRSTTLRDIVDVVVALHTDPHISELPEDAVWDKKTAALLQEAVNGLVALDEYTTHSIQTMIKQVCAQHGAKLPDLAKPIRFALTGKMDSPSVFSLMQLLGLDMTCHRIKRLEEFLHKGVK